MTLLGLALFALNIAVGLVAWRGRVHFGRFHHVLYAAVFVAAAMAAIVEFHPGLVVTLVALAVLPAVPARSPLHPTLAVVGLVGYLAALIH